MKDHEIIDAVDLLISQLLLCVEKNDYSGLKIKVYRNQPPKKIDVEFQHPMYRGTRIKIRDVKVDDKMNVNFKSDVNIKFYGFDFNILNDEQTKRMEYFVLHVSKAIIKQYFLSK